MKMTDYRIGLRLHVGFSAIVLIGAAVSIFALREMHELADFTSEMYQHPLAVSNAVRDIRANINAMHQSMKDVVLAADIDQVHDAAALVDQLEREVRDEFDITFKRFLGDMSDVERAYKAFIEWKPIRDEVIALSESGRYDSAADITRGKGARHVAFMTSEIQTMIDYAGNKADSFFQTRKEKENNSRLS